MSQLNSRCTQSMQPLGIALICREYRVREAWLRDGDGPMFELEPIDDVDALAAKYHDATPEMRVLIKQLIALPADKQDELMGWLRDTVARFPPRQAPAEMSPEDLHAELDRQLAMEKTAGDESEVS